MRSALRNPYRDRANLEPLRNPADCPAEPPGVAPHAACRRARRRYISARFSPKARHCDKNLRRTRRIRAAPTERAPNGPSIRLSHAGSVQDLSGQPQGFGERQPVVLSGRQDRRARRQRRRQVDAAAHHGRASTRSSPARPGRPRAPASATWRRSRSSMRQQSVRENVMDGRGAAEGDPRPLQRAGGELLRRDRRRDDQAAGRDRGQGAVGSRLQGRSGDGRAALPGRRCRGGEALRRRAAPRGAVPAAARAARSAAARRADQPSRRRIGDVARRPSAQLSGRHPDRHPRPLLPRQRHRLDPRARPRPRHSLRGQLFVVAGAEAEAARAGRPRGRGAPAHARPRAGMDQRPPRAPARPNPRRATSATRSC